MSANADILSTSGSILLRNFLTMNHCSLLALVFTGQATNGKMRWLPCHPGSDECAQSRGSTGGEGGPWLAGWSTGSDGVKGVGSQMM